jgi:hypothetical protein
MKHECRKTKGMIGIRGGVSYHAFFILRLKRDFLMPQHARMIPAHIF